MHFLFSTPTPYIQTASISSVDKQIHPLYYVGCYSLSIILKHSFSTYTFVKIYCQLIFPDYPYRQKQTAVGKLDMIDIHSPQSHMQYTSLWYNNQ